MEFLLVQLRNNLPLLESEDLDTLALNFSENFRSDGFIRNIKPLLSVTKEPHRETASLSDARAIFDAIIREFLDSGN